jgi:hypothetical protein
VESLAKEGLAVIAFLSLYCLAVEAGMKHTQVHLRLHWYTLNVLFHYKSAVVLHITSNIVKPRYKMEPAYNVTARNGGVFPVANRFRYIRVLLSFDPRDCKSFPLKTGFVMPGFRLRQVHCICSPQFLAVNRNNL